MSTGWNGTSSGGGSTPGRGPRRGPTRPTKNPDSGRKKQKSYTPEQVAVRRSVRANNQVRVDKYLSDLHSWRQGGGDAWLRSLGPRNPKPRRDPGR